MPMSGTAPAIGADLPDLIVTAVSAQPAQPHTGDSVHLQAVVKNQGTAATPAGTVIGGVFSVDGSNVVYTDNYSDSLAPGASVTLTSNGGGSIGDGTWIAQTGTHTLSFLVDDVNRIAESREDNNSFTDPTQLSVTEPDGPDLTIDRLTFSPAYLPPGSQPSFRAHIHNIGDEPTGGPVEVRFSIAGQQIMVTGAALAAGAKETLSTRPVDLGQPSVQQITAAVDPRDLIAETHEDNNSSAIVFARGEKFRSTAQQADSFVDSIGVNTHLSYYDTPYGNYRGIVKPLLAASGIRHIRDSASPAQTDVIAKFKDLATIGVGVNLLASGRGDPQDPVTVAKAAAPAVESIEGPNEPNLFTADLFPDGTRSYQAQLYTAVKADPATHSLPVIAPSPVLGTAGKLGPVACDIGNMHPYPGGQVPTSGLASGLKDARTVCPDKPVWATETGYHNAVHATSGQPGVSERAAAKYIPRTYLDYFTAGVQRTFVYEFVDEFKDAGRQNPEARFGMVHRDGTPKQSFYAMKNLIGLLADQGKSFKPGMLPYSLSGDVTNLHQLLLQKRDGSYQLILWLDTKSYDLSSHSNVSAPQQSVNLDLPAMFASATTYLPVTSATVTNHYTRPEHLTLNISDQPLVIALRR